MTNYILKLTAGTTYKLYDGEALVEDTALTTLFSTAGSAYFSFDFDGNTPAATDELTITNSEGTTVVTNTGLTDAIEEGKNYKGIWSEGATEFYSFESLGGVAMDESQLSTLMGKVKTAMSLLPAGEVSLNDLDDGVYLMNPRATTITNTLNAQDFMSKMFVNQETTPDPYLVRIGYSSPVIFVIQENGSENYKVARFFGASSPQFRYPVVSKYIYNTNIATSNNWSIGGGSSFSDVSLGVGTIYNGLTSNSMYAPLSAKQGKVLNDKIGGDLSSLTTTDKTSLINAINEIAAGGGAGVEIATPEDVEAILNGEEES